MLFFKFRNGQNKILIGPPPPQKKGAGLRTVVNMVTHMRLFTPAACDLGFYYVDIDWFGARKLRNNPAGI